MPLQYFSSPVFQLLIGSALQSWDFQCSSTAERQLFVVLTNTEHFTMSILSSFSKAFSVIQYFMTNYLRMPVLYCFSPVRCSMSNNSPASIWRGLRLLGKASTVDWVFSVGGGNNSQPTCEVNWQLWSMSWSNDSHKAFSRILCLFKVHKVDRYWGRAFVWLIDSFHC